MKRALFALIAFVFTAGTVACATTPKPITYEQFQHKEAMQDLDKELKKEEKEKKKDAPN